MPLIPDLPAPDDATTDDTAPIVPVIAPASNNDTQKLTPRLVASSRTTQTWWNRLSQPITLPHATQLGLSAAGGAVAVVLVSLSIGWIVGREPLRDFFGRTDGAAQPLPERVALPLVAPVQTEIEAQPETKAFRLLRDEPVQIEGANEDGTALAELQPLTDDDRRRIEKRREDDRLLREKRALEDKKRAVERELEDKQLEERRRGEDAQAIDGRRAEDKKRIEDRLSEDRRLLDERKQKEHEAIANAQREDEHQQLADAQP